MHLLFLELIISVLGFPLLLSSIFYKKNLSLNKIIGLVVLFNTILNILFVFAWIKIVASSTPVEYTDSNRIDDALITIAIVVIGLVNCYILKYFYESFYKNKDHIKKIKIIGFSQFIILMSYFGYVFYFKK